MAHARYGRRVLGPYATVLRLPGALKFSVAGLIGRLPISMLGLGIVLLVSITQRSYSLAGLLASLFTVSAALVTPMSSRSADRFGQVRVLPILIAVHALALIAFVELVNSGASELALIATASLAGASEPPVGSMVRARWSALLSGTTQLGVAFALESVIDEIVFIIGPVLATVLAINVSPGAAILASAGLAAIGGLWLASQKRTQPRPSLIRVSRADREAMGVAVPIVGIIFVFLGVLFGALEVGTVAFTTERGAAWSSGIVLASLSLGSMFGGLAFGTRISGRNLPKQLLLLLVVSTVALTPLPFLQTIPTVAILGFIVGIATAPSLICGFTVVENLVPASRLTESITWTLAGIGIGVAASASLCGAAIDQWGAWAAFGIGVAGAALATVASALTLPRLSRAWHERGLDMAEHPNLAT